MGIGMGGWRLSFIRGGWRLWVMGRCGELWEITERVGER